MAVYDLEEQEQLEELKTWWKQHGNLVTTVVTVIALIAAAWQGWNWWQRSQSVKASAVYAVLEQAAAAHDAKKVREIAGELIEKYPSTTYAAMGAMLSARAQVEFGDSKTAHAQLQWVASNSKDDLIRDLARLREATLLADEKSYDDALKLLSIAPQIELAARFDELKGDVFVAQGKKADAATAYADALAAVDKLPKSEGVNPHEAYREMIQTKIDSLGVAK